jgi:hypothetical protein
MSDPVHIISLGAGVQSSTMALMAARGLITPMPTAAIFADTQDEPESVYRWLDWLEKQLPFPVHRVTAGRLSDRSLTMVKTKDGRLFSKTDIPFYTLNNDGSVGKIMNRGCTRDFKIKPIMRAARRIAEVKRGEKSVRVIQWIGISLDEVTRMKESRDKWAKSRWPLVELRKNRHDCLRWMQVNGYPVPPRSACIYCPFHNNAEWRRLRSEEPIAFAQAVGFERELQRVKSASQNFKTKPFLHRSCVPLDQVDLSTDEERGFQNLFENECEGMCGV